MHFLSEDLERYAEQHSQQEPPLLAALVRETHLRVLQPRMLSGHLQGRLLSVLSKLLAPSYIVEIGTFTGYATLCLAEGLAPSGRLHTIEANEEYEDIQNKYFGQSPYREQIVQHFAPALEVLPTLPYADYARPRLIQTPKGLLISVLDQQNHQLYLLNAQGEIYPNFPIYALSQADVTVEAGKLLLTFLKEKNTVTVVSEK